MTRNRIDWDRIGQASVLILGMALGFGCPAVITWLILVDGKSLADLGFRPGSIAVPAVFCTIMIAWALVFTVSLIKLLTAPVCLRCGAPIEQYGGSFWRHTGDGDPCECAVGPDDS